jgi:hypothetical protein
MTFEGYDAFDDPYAYPGTNVLKNLLDIRDQATLEAFEVAQVILGRRSKRDGNCHGRHSRNGT